MAMTKKEIEDRIPLLVELESSQPPSWWETGVERWRYVRAVAREFLQSDEFRGLMVKERDRAFAALMRREHPFQSRWPHR